MAIKMRNSKNEHAKCASCGLGQKESLNMFDLCIGKEIFTICDECNSALLKKSLTAECSVNARLKSPMDMQIIRRRNQRNESKNGMSLNDALRGVKDESE